MLVPIRPFPAKLRTKLSWTPPIIAYAPGTPSGAFVIALTNPVDMDATNVLGSTTQPLYWDQLCAAAGPYFSFLVHGWKAHIVIDNTVSGAGMEQISMAATEYAADIDTIAELQSSNCTQWKYHGIPGTPQSLQELFWSGRTVDYIPSSNLDSTHSGAFATAPATVVHLSVGLRTLTGANVTANVFVQIELDIELWNTDGAAS